MVAGLGEGGVDAQGGLEVGLGLLGLAQAGQDGAQVVVGVGRVGLQPEGGRVLEGGLGQIALGRQRVGQVVMDIGIIKSVAQGCLIILDCLRQIALPRKGESHEIKHVRGIRDDFQGRLVVGHGLLRSALSVQGHAQKRVGYRIIGRRRDGMAEKGDGVFPIAELDGSERHAGGQCQCACRAQNQAPARPALRQISDAPGQHDENSDRGQVGVAVGHGLRAHLHQPDHRDERAQEPEPAHHQVRTPPGLHDNRKRDGREQRRCADPLPKWHMVWERVNDRQIGGPDHFSNVRDIRDQGIEDAITQWNFVQLSHRAAALLGNESYNAGTEHQRKHRRLLPEHERPPRRADHQRLRVPRFRTPHSALRTSAKGPIVQQQQHKRQGDGHGFGQQRQRQAEQGQAVESAGLGAFDPGLLHVADIGGHGQEPEEGAQNILALGHPGHRFDVERMPGEEGGHQRAAPSRAGQAQEHAKEQERVGQVKEQAGQVVAGGFEPVKLAVQLVRQPCQRMPVE